MEPARPCCRRPSAERSSSRPRAAKRRGIREDVREGGVDRDDRIGLASPYRLAGRAAIAWRLAAEPVNARRSRDRGRRRRPGHSPAGEPKGDGDSHQGHPVVEVGTRVTRDAIEPGARGKGPVDDPKRQRQVPARACGDPDDAVAAAVRLARWRSAPRTRMNGDVVTPRGERRRDPRRPRVVHRDDGTTMPRRWGRGTDPLAPGRGQFGCRLSRSPGRRRVRSRGRRGQSRIQADEASAVHLPRIPGMAAPRQRGAVAAFRGRSSRVRIAAAMAAGSVGSQTRRAGRRGRP